MMTELLAAIADADAPQGGLDLAIEVGDSTMVHRQRYAVLTSRETVIDLLALDEFNPRSVRFQLGVIGKQVQNLSAGRAPGQMTAFERKVLALETSLALHSVQTLDTASLKAIHAEILDLSIALNSAFLH